ncbi:hypothetical protein CLAIMM_12920 [Cladophialophora immunda]|nr:hypothetical protein CLAIMM_12920 [Cladophialophora immunda]
MAAASLRTLEACPQTYYNDPMGFSRSDHALLRLRFNRYHPVVSKSIVHEIEIPTNLGIYLIMESECNQYSAGIDKDVQPKGAGNWPSTIVFSAGGCPLLVLK